MNKLTEEIVKDHADLSAVYLKTLLARGIELATAVELTMRYAQTLVIVLFNTSPKEPWEI